MRSHTKFWSAVGPLLRALVDKTPGINQVIVHTGKGFPIVAWPKGSIIRATVTALSVPSLLRTTDDFDRQIDIRGFDCAIAQLAARTLFILSIGGNLHLTVDAAKSCDVRIVSGGISRVVSDIARVATQANSGLYR